MRSKTSLGSSREVVQGSGVSFANCLYLVPLIIGQNFCATHATINQTGPRAASTLVVVEDLFPDKGVINRIEIQDVRETLRT